MNYTQEDFEIDVEYLVGIGLDRAEAIDFLTQVIERSGGFVEPY